MKKRMAKEASIDPKILEQALRRTPMLKDVSKEDLATFTDCGSTVVFEAGEVIFKAGGKADQFFLLEEGRVAVEIQVGEEDPIVIQTLGPGEVLGWSWIFPPYLWQFDGRAMEAVKAIALDARCIRGKLEDNPRLGYWLMKQFSKILMDRLSATRIQVMDIYGR